MHQTYLVPPMSPSCKKVYATPVDGATCLWKAQTQTFQDASPEAVAPAASVVLGSTVGAATYLEARLCGRDPTRQPEEMSEPPIRGARPKGSAAAGCTEKAKAAPKTLRSKPIKSERLAARYCARSVRDASLTIAQMQARSKHRAPRATLLCRSIGGWSEIAHCRLHRL